jgi:hypothetical protein
MLRDFGRSTRSVVGDEQNAGPNYGQCFDRADRRFMSAENGAVEVEK